jgi:hypothetical protein
MKKLSVLLSLLAVLAPACTSETNAAAVAAQSAVKGTLEQISTQLGTIKDAASAKAATDMLSKLVGDLGPKIENLKKLMGATALTTGDLGRVVSDVNAKITILQANKELSAGPLGDVLSKLRAMLA